MEKIKTRPVFKDLELLNREKSDLAKTARLFVPTSLQPVVLQKDKKGKTKLHKEGCLVFGSCELILIASAGCDAIIAVFIVVAPEHNGVTCVFR